jgi:diguanylate cyclase (GGDEF)-like protein
VGQQRSALDVWKSIGDEPSMPHATAELVPVVVSAAGAIGLAPFAVMRWMSGEVPIATMDTAVIVGFVCLGLYVYQTRKVRAASVLIALIGVVGVMLSVRFRGVGQMPWAFPAMLACFFLLRPREALAMTMALCIVICLQLQDSASTGQLAAFIATMLISTVFAFGFSIINNRQHDKLVSLAAKDPLTGAGNRRAFVERLAEVIARFNRSGMPSSLVLIDIDHFKSVNDNHGHAAGDEILCSISSLIGGRIREVDGHYRIGGEEFVVVFEGENLGSATRLAEDLRQRVDGCELLPGVSVTLSIGVAQIREQESDDRWIRRADEAMYEAKRSGRNRVRVAG